MCTIKVEARVRECLKSKNIWRWNSSRTPCFVVKVKQRFIIQNACGTHDHFCLQYANRGYWRANHFLAMSEQDYSTKWSDESKRQEFMYINVKRKFNAICIVYGFGDFFVILEDHKKICLFHWAIIIHKHTKKLIAKEFQN